jgi:hypothetical protein
MGCFGIWQEDPVSEVTGWLQASGLAEIPHGCIRIGVWRLHMADNLKSGGRVALCDNTASINWDQDNTYYARFARGRFCGMLAYVHMVETINEQSAGGYHLLLCKEFQIQLLVEKPHNLILRRLTPL